VRKKYLAKINNLSNHHGAGPPEARGPMQPHRLHRLKAGPAAQYKTTWLTASRVIDGRKGGEPPPWQA